MKTLGLIGGTGWVSSIDYYKMINQGINKLLGGHESARLILFSINFADIVKYNTSNETKSIYVMIEDAVRKVIRAGAESIVLCANTLHKFAEQLQMNIDVPIIHIGDAVAREINDSKLSTVGLLGTLQTMEGNFFIDRLKKANIATIIPNKQDRELTNNIIYNELLLEKFNMDSKKNLIEITKRLQMRNAEGIILGCTELPLIIKDDELDVPIFNTTAIHARAAVNFALGE